MDSEHPDFTELDNSFDTTSILPENVIEDVESRRSILEDILPSFQMHNHIFNRTLYDENDEDSSADCPPDYTSEINTIRSIRPVDPNRFIDPLENPNLILLNNINKIPIVEVPIGIKITLTKRQPMIGKAYERESPLTQYKPGDLVTGYVKINCTNKQPIPFEMMLVSLEGEIKTPAGGLKSTDRKIISRTFLRMYDLNACYNHSPVNFNSYGSRSCMETDNSDNTKIGFDGTRRVIPGIVHKKFFTFKLPYALLDTTCPDQMHNHLKLLPSFGFDEQSLELLDEDLEVDPILGYKRFDAFYGSPIKVNDMALKGQSISYYVRVQMIGRSAAVKNLSRNSPRDIETPFVILSDERHYFRVDVSENINNFKVDSDILVNEAGVVNSNIRTYEQMTNFENFVVKTIQELKTKKQLKEAGVIDRREQENIIADLDIDESKKEKQLRSSTNFHPEIIRGNNQRFLHYDSVKLGKDLFTRSGGDVIIKASISRDSSIHSIKCFALKDKPSSKLNSKPENSSAITVNNSLNTHRTNYQEEERNNSVPLTTKTSSSDNSLSTIQSLQSLRQIKQGHCFVELELTFIPENKSILKPELPSSITINPTLKAVNIYSTLPIPVSIDGEFLMDEQLLQYTIPNIRRQFDIYLTELKRLVQEVPVPRTFYNSVNSLSKLSAKEAYVPNFEFFSETINLNNKWEYDPNEKVYRAIIKFPLAVNSKQINKSTLCLVPSFESCLVNQFYMVHFHVSIKKSKKYSVFKFPLKVI